ncbi:hypothetical protein [Arthrobacter sp. AQ5-05]|uniref:hypothetical protein n=1 Tax=Arthrobacter sp. AQ5-05 TaxID=2184581 RepID=UPI0012B64391|nr:hypothetical protein [Arthrobacter sp. AQ5-05]
MSVEPDAGKSILIDEALGEEIARLSAALQELGSQRDVTLALSLIRTFTVVVEEASRTARFAKALVSASATPASHGKSDTKPRSRRRPPGSIDPYAVYNDGGPEGLQQELQKLDIEGLRDIVAEHGMDPDRLAMKWKDPSRVIDRIVTRVAARAAKGSAFR